MRRKYASVKSIYKITAINTSHRESIQEKNEEKKKNKKAEGEMIETIL